MGTIAYKPTTHWNEFNFYASGGVDGAFKESLSLGKAFKIGDVRLHLSIVHPSVEDFVIWVSSANGSAYNLILISQAISGIKDYMWIPTNPIIFDSDDQLVFSLFIVSASNTYGLDVRGWAVNG